MKITTIAATSLLTLAACGGSNLTINEAEAPAFELPSIHVVDGDTIDIDGDRIRLAGFDAPEKYQRCRDANDLEWKCGLASMDMVRELVSSGELVCTGRGSSYNRSVKSCTVDGKDLGALMVSAGLAVDDPRYGPDYSDDEKQARLDGRGMHAGRYLAPWDWRSGKRLGITLPRILLTSDVDVGTLPKSGTGRIMNTSDESLLYGEWVGKSAYAVFVNDDTWTGISWAPHSPDTNPVARDGSARWNGKMVGYEPEEGIINGKATIALDGFSNPRANIALTNLTSVNGTQMPSIRWYGLPVIEGEFESGLSSNRVLGRFYGDRHQEVGGTFQHDTVVGSFGASRQ